LYVQKMQGILQSSKDRLSTAREIMNHLQAHLGSTLEATTFITAVAAVFDRRRSTVEVARAGHLPLLVRRGRRIQEVKPPGVWLGKAEMKAFEGMMQPVSLDVKNGDALLFFTDGIVETSNAQKREFGLPRLKKTFSTSNGTAKSIVSKCFKAVGAFSHYSPVLDDKTFVAVRVQSL
ncbi:MAG: serine/threonine-protein phosphatase, partial [Ignavibacteriales bacterium]|nr:serine/threonine-protein phosphatase [Ignavibacteriales bacterium]